MKLNYIQQLTHLCKPKPIFIYVCIKYFKTKTFQKHFLPPKYSSKKERERFDQFSTLKNDFENQNFQMFEEVVHNFGKSDDDNI